MSIRSQILRGAADAFGQRGFGATSVQHILKEARVSRRTFYRLFRNKKDVLHEIFETAGMMLIQAIRQAATLGRTPQENLENCIEVYVRAPKSAGPILQVLQAEASRPGSKLAQRREQLIEEIVRVVDEQVRLERNQEIDPLIYRGVLAAMEAISNYVYTETAASEQDIERAKQAMVRIFAGSVGEPEANKAAA